MVSACSGLRLIRVHINLHFVRVNPGAGMLLLSAGGKFSVTEKLGIAEEPSIGESSGHSSRSCFMVVAMATDSGTGPRMVWASAPGAAG